MSTRATIAITAPSPPSPRRGALQMLGAALLGFADACRDIRLIARTG